MDDRRTLGSSDKVQQFKFFAFISYSHQDNRDRRFVDDAAGPKHVRWAEWLHNALETYRVPRIFVSTEDKRGESIPSRLILSSRRSGATH